MFDANNTSAGLLLALLIGLPAQAQWADIEPRKIDPGFELKKPIVTNVRRSGQPDGAIDCGSIESDILRNPDQGSTRYPDSMLADCLDSEVTPVMLHDGLILDSAVAGQPVEVLLNAPFGGSGVFSVRMDPPSLFDGRVRVATDGRQILLHTPKPTSLNLGERDQEFTLTLDWGSHQARYKVTWPVELGLHCTSCGGSESPVLSAFVGDPISREYVFSAPLAR